jgi:hypothetical protein
MIAEVFGNLLKELIQVPGQAIHRRAIFLPLILMFKDKTIEVLA